MSRAARALVKICGVTRSEDALAAAELGADFIGVNLWPGSPRHVGLERAREIVETVAGRARMVGVFVDADPERVELALAASGLDLAQLHGDEPESAVAALGPRAIRVFRGVPAQAAIDAAAASGVGLFLVDAYDPLRRGGSGAAWDWSRLAPLRFPAPVLVAGGIRPGNAAAALAASGADGVDVASGVEREPGVKDHALLRKLIEEVRGGETIARP